MVANPREGHIWRSMMWRVMNPPRVADRTQKEEQVSNQTSRRIRNLCYRIGKDFKNGYAKLLLEQQESRDDRMERARTLRAIFMDAAEIATSLWTQRPYLVCCDLEAIESRNISFNIASSIMEAHPLSKVDYDDPSHNNRVISVVTRPALLAFSEDDHEASGQNARVLSKAVVWLGD
jgi:hypothetical protein